MPRLGDELDPHVAHAVVGGLEAVDPQEQADAFRELTSDRTRLRPAISLSEQQRALVAPGGRTTTHRFGRPSLVRDGESSTSSKPRASTKNRRALS